MADRTGNDGFATATAELESAIEELAAEYRDDPGAFHDAMAEMVAATPEAMQAVLIGMLCRRPGGFFQRQALYWLLHRAAPLRRAAADALAWHAAAGRLDAGAGRLLEMARDWLPADEAHAVVEQVLRTAATVRQQRRGPAGKGKPPALFATLPDGSGAQSFIVLRRVGGRPAVVAFLLKAGFGLIDALVLPCRSAREQQEILSRMRDEACGAWPVTRDCLQRHLAAAVAEGLKAALPPPAGLIDAAEALGLETLVPRPMAAADWLAELKPAGVLDRGQDADGSAAIESSDSWASFYPIVESWQEVPPPLPAGIADDRAAATESLWRLLEERRGFWAGLMLRAADVLCAAGEVNGADFAVVAKALLDGAPLRSLPIMAQMAEVFPYELDEREAAHAALGPDADLLFEEPDLEWERPAEPGELEALLRRSGSGGSPAWLDGRVVAALAAPRPLPAPEMFGEILQGLLRAGTEDTPQVHRLVGLILNRFETLRHLMAEAPDATRELQRLRRTRALPDWSEGFLSLSNRGVAWQGAALRADDRKMLQALAAIAKGRSPEPAELRLFGQWLARRIGMQN